MRYIHARLAKRDLDVDTPSTFPDDHYPTWYGADFSNVCNLRVASLIDDELLII